MSKHFTLVLCLYNEEELYIVLSVSVAKAEIKSYTQKSQKNFNIMETHLLSSTNALKWSRIYWDMIAYLVIW